MTPHSFFVILIKLLGLYFMWATLSMVLSIFSGIGVYFQPDEEGILYVLLFITVSILLLMAYIIRTCLYRPEVIINKLELDKGFSEERFEIAIHRSTILSIAVIVTGALILIDALPSFCQQFLTYVREMKISGEGTKSYVALYALKSIIGYLLLTNNTRIVALIEQKRRINNT